MRLVRLVQAALRASAAQLYSFSIESIQSVLKAPHQRIAVSIETQTDLSLSLLTHLNVHTVRDYNGFKLVGLLNQIQVNHWCIFSCASVEVHLALRKLLSVLASSAV